MARYQNIPFMLELRKWTSVTVTAPSFETCCTVSACLGLRLHPEQITDKRLATMTRRKFGGALSCARGSPADFRMTLIPSSCSTGRLICRRQWPSESDRECGGYIFRSDVFNESITASRIGCASWDWYNFRDESVGSRWFSDRRCSVRRPHIPARNRDYVLRVVVFR